MIEQYVVGLMIQIVRLAGGCTLAARTRPAPGGRRAGRVRVRGARRFQGRSERVVDGHPLFCAASLPVASAAGSRLGRALREIAALNCRRKASWIRCDWRWCRFSPMGAMICAGLPRPRIPSSRTLRRRLDELGLTWTEFVDQTRFDLARRRLEDSGLKIAEIAREVSYADPANFTRAFRRWTGEAPSLFRDRS